MLKPLTLSLSLVVALGASSVSMAGLFDKHHSGVLASPQGVVASSQQIMPSGQCDTGGCGGGDACAPEKKKCKLLGFLHKPKNYSYTWVLKKKRIHGHKGGDCGGGAMGGCDSCDTGASVYPSGQYSSPQASGSGQSYGSSQAYGTGQAYGGSSGQAYSGASGQAYGGSSGQAYGGSSGQAYGGSSGQAYGAGQATGTPQPTSTSAGQMTPAAPAGDEAPPAPEVPAPAPAAPAAPEAPSPNAPQSSLLFSTPSGN